MKGGARISAVEPGGGAHLYRLPPSSRAATGLMWAPATGTLTLPSGTVHPFRSPDVRPGSLMVFRIWRRRRETRHQHWTAAAAARGRAGDVS